MKRKKMSPRRVRVTATGVLCGTASALFITPAALLPGAGVSPMLVFCGLTIPAGVAGLFWAVTYRQTADLDTTVPWPPRRPDPELRAAKDRLRTALLNRGGAR